MPFGIPTNSLSFPLTVSEKRPSEAPARSPVGDGLNAPPSTLTSTVFDSNEKPIAPVTKPKMSTVA